MKKYCDCVDKCRRAGREITEDGDMIAWFCPYLPECFGGPEPYCRLADFGREDDGKIREVPINYSI